MGCWITSIEIAGETGGLGDLETGGLGEGENARTEQSFVVPFAEIKANGWDLSINRYKEVEHREVAYDSPTSILKDIRQLDAERAEALKKLEELLKCKPVNITIPIFRYDSRRCRTTYNFATLS